MTFLFVSQFTTYLLWLLPVIPGRCEASNYDVRLHIGESRDSGAGADAPSRNDGVRVYFLSAPSLARWPNMFLRASSSKGSLTNLPIASPACTCGRARTSAYQRLMFG